MSFFPYPEYRDSGLDWIGEVPSHWESWKIAHAFKNIGSGTTPPSTEGKWYEDGEIPWITTGELRENIVTDTKKSITREALCAFPALRLHSKGSLAIAMYGATIGRLGILGVDATTNQACSVMESSTDLAVKFLFYWLHCNRTTIVALFSTGGGQPNINQEAVTSLRVPAPSLAAQTQIARFLDHETAKIDALIQEQKRLIELLQEKRQAVISHAVTKGLDPDVPMKDSGVEWLGEVPAHWVPLGVRRIAKNVSTGGTPSLEIPDSTTTDGFNWFTPGDFKGVLNLGESGKKISRSSVNSGDAKLFPGGSVLIVGIGATLGKTAIFLEPFSANQQINVVIPNAKISEYFLAYSLMMQTEQMRVNANASTIGIMNQEKTKDLVLALPPITEQLQITEKLDQVTKRIDELVTESESAMILLRERRSAIISTVVTGKIDVRDWKPPADESAFDAEVRQTGLGATA